MTAEPYKDTTRVLIDKSHQVNLVEPLLVILLIYAKSIDPQTTHSMAVSKMLQSNFQIICDMSIKACKGDRSKIT